MTEANESPTLLAFTLLGRRFAVELPSAREILRYRRPTPLPRVPPFIEGVIAVRGEVVPVIDLRRRLELGEGERPESRLLLVRTRDDSSAALRIDQIVGVLRPSPLTPASAPLLRGVVTRGEPTSVLDLDAVLAWRGST